MRPAFVGIDRIDVGNDVFSVRAVVVHRYLHGYILIQRLDVDRCFNDFFTGFVQILNKLYESPFREKFIGFWISVFLNFPKVFEVDSNTCIQVRHLPESICDGFILKFSNGKNTCVRLEVDDGTTLLRFSHFPGRILRHTDLKFLFGDDSISMNGCLKVGRQCVHTGYPYTMKSTGNFVGVFIKFPPGMKHGEHNFQG